MAAPVFTAVNTMDTRVSDTLSQHNLTSSAQAQRILWINQAIEYIQRQFDVLKDDFVSNTTATTDFQVDAAAPYPYRIDAVWYNTSTNKKKVDYADRATVDADIAAANTTVYRYALFKDTNKHYIRFNATCGAITGGLTLHGPYLPDYIVAGGTLPFEQKYDDAIEAVAVLRGIESLSEDPNKRTLGQAKVQEALAQVGLAER